MFNEDQGRDEDTLIMSDDQFMNGNPIVTPPNTLLDEEEREEDSHRG